MTKQEANEELKDNLGRVIHPLPILCRVDGEYGGGDYTEDMLNGEYLGRRAGDVISVNELPKDYDEEFVIQGFYDKTDIYCFRE